MSDFHRCYYTFIYCSKSPKIRDFHRWNSWYVIFELFYLQETASFSKGIVTLIYGAKMCFIEFTREYFISEGYNDFILWKLKTSFIEITRDCFVSEEFSDFSKGYSNCISITVKKCFLEITIEYSISQEYSDFDFLKLK